MSVTQLPSVRRALELGWSVRQHPIGQKAGWSFYWMEGGAELTLYPGDEGPQEMRDVDEALECIGGDQPCYLTPASEKRLAALGTLEQGRVLGRLLYPAPDIANVGAFLRSVMEEHSTTWSVTTDDADQDGTFYLHDLYSHAEYEVSVTRLEIKA